MERLTCQLCEEDGVRGSYTERGAYLPICGRCMYERLSREEREIAERLQSEEQRKTALTG